MAEDHITMSISDAQRYLPLNRVYKPMEAYVTLLIDQAQNNSDTIRGYARQWGWKRYATKTFLTQNSHKTASF